MNVLYIFSEVLNSLLLNLPPYLNKKHACAVSAHTSILAHSL